MDRDRSVGAHFAAVGSRPPGAPDGRRDERARRLHRGLPAAASGDGVVAATFSSTALSAVIAVSRYAGVGEIDLLPSRSANSRGLTGDSWAVVALEIALPPLLP